MQQAQPNLQWQHPPMNAATIQQSWTYGQAIPSIVPQQVPTPVARKQVPSRKPVGQAVSPQETVAPQNSKSTSRQSVSSISSLPSLSGSVTSPITRGVPTQPTFQSPPIIKQLPVGWIICNDADGRTYFFNTITNHSSWEPPESEIITPNYGFPPTFTPVTYAHVPVPQSLPISQPTIQSTDAFSHMNIAPHLSQMPTPITPQQQQISPTTTFPSQSPSTFTTQPQSISPTNSFSSQSRPFSQPVDLQWETYPADHQPSRRKSRFSMPKGFTAPKIDTASVRNGAKIAGQTSMKGAKIAGKALKNNRKVIGAGVKIANAVLKETTGVTIPGAGLIAGDSDNDDDGVLGAVGAIGSMIGGGTGNDCDVYVEVDEISIDNDGTVEVEREEADIYQDQGSLEGLGSLHHQEQIIRAAVMSQVQQSAKQPHNRRKQLANDPQRQGQAISNQGSEVAAPARGQNLQSSNGSTSGRKPLQTSKIQQPTISTRQFQPDESQTQENSKSRPTKAAGATENMQATLQEVSNLAKGFSGIFRDVEVEGSSNECGENYDKTQDSVACEERNEQYSIEAVDFAEQIHGGIAMESTEAIYSEDICSNGACEVDYSTLDGSVAFCGEQGSFTINEVEHTATKRVAYSENTQSSEIVHQKSYTVETVEITDSYQQETNFEKVNLIQETQVSEASDQETTTDVYAIKNLEPAATFGEGEEERGINSQEESSSAFQNTAQNNFDSWNSNSLLEQSPWAQENAMLQENVWATEPANLPSTQETDVWAKSPQQSTSQHASYSETIFAEETVVRQETILSDTVTYTESNAIISQDFPYNENNCTEFTIIESSIIQENAQQQYTTNKAIFAEQTAAHDSVQEAMATQSTSFEVTNATMDGPFQEKKSDGETETNADTAVVETGQEETVTIHNSGFCHTRFVESDMVQELPEQATQNVIIPDENGSPPKTVVNTKMTTMMANNTSTSGNFQQRVYSQQNGQGQAFCIERDVVAPRGAQFSLQVEPYDSGAATFIETEIITLEIDHGQTQKTGSDTKTVSTQKEAMRGGDFVIETESYIETNSVVTNAVQEPSQERSVAKDEHPENHFIIHDTRHAETKLVMEATVPLVVNGKVVGVQTRSIEENMSAIPPLTLQQMNQTAPFNIEAISIVLTPPEETAQMQSFTIDDQTYTEEDVARYVAAHEPTDKVQCSSATPQDEKFSKDAVQQSSKPPQAFAIFAGSNNTLDASEPATPRSFHEEFLMAERNACPTPEEEHPYSSIVQSKQQDEFELFFDVRPRPPTQVREIHAEDRALKDTHVTEQLRVFLERQALIFQSAANKEGVDPEYRHLPEITGVEPVAGISIPPPPPYPPPLRHRTPAQCAKPNTRGILPYPDHPSSSPERALNPSKSPGTLPYPERPSYSPEPPSQPATSPTSPPSPAQQRPREQPPTKPPHSWTIPPAPLALALKPPTPRPESLATILHEAIATSQVQAPTTPPATHLSTTPNQSTSPTAQTYHELPTLQDAREEPNIIAMSAAEQYATAMFASGEFLGDDLGCRGHVEEEENVLPEVVMINV